MPYTTHSTTDTLIKRSGGLVKSEIRIRRSMDPLRERLIAERKIRNISAGEHDVLTIVADLMECPGGAFPTQETLAQKALVSRSTAQRALRRAKEIGLLDWENRRNGRYQTSNLYKCTYKRGDPLKTVTRSARQNDAQKDLSKKEPEHTAENLAWLRTNTGGNDLITARREATEARLAAEWRAKHA